MGISRRKFLGFVSAALAGSTINPLKAVIVHDDYYANQDLGLGFIKPASWNFESFKDFGYLMDKVILSRFDEYTASSIKESFVEPLVLISRYSLESKCFNPSIQVYLDNYDGTEMYEDLADMIPETIETNASINQSFELREPFSETTVSGYRAFEIKSKCLTENEDIHPTISESRTQFNGYF